MAKQSASAFVKSLIGDRPQVKKDFGPYLVKNEDLQFSVARVMACGLLKNQFYRSKDASAKEALQLFKKAARTDPQFLLKAAAFSRSGHMKGMVLLGLASLAGGASDSFLAHKRDQIIGILSTFGPNQLLQFVELMKSKALGRGFGARPQKWVQAVMESWSPDKLETFTLKYPASVKTLLRLVHPSYRDARRHLMTYVLDRSSFHPNYGHSCPGGRRQKAVERLKNGNSLPATVAKTMLEYEIPWDVVKGFYAGYNSGDVGLATLTQMGLNALLLNIRSLEQQGVFNNADGRKALKLKLNEVKNGRSIPLDFAKPYLYSTNAQVKNLLADAIADTLGNKLPALEGRKIGLSIDVSGSMEGEALLTAGLLAVPFLNAKNLWFTTFSDFTHREGEIHNHTLYTGWGNSGNRLACPKITGEDPRIQVKRLMEMQVVGGTNLAHPVEVAIKENRKLDLFVIITDEHQNSGHRRLMTAWKNYLRQVNPRAQLWIVNASNYDLHAADLDDPSVIVYQTMTPAIFKNLEFFGQDLVSAIDSFDMSKLRKVNPKRPQ